MDGDDVGAGFSEGFEEMIDRRDHQMDIEGLLRVRTERLHHAGSYRDVGDEMAVHHVDMDPVGAGLVNGTDFLAQAREIGRSEEHTSELQPTIRTSYAVLC